MKIFKLSFSLVIVASLLLVVVSCEKEIARSEKIEKLISELSTELRADSLESYVRWMEGMNTRFTLADNRRDVAVAIQNKFKSLGIHDVKLDSFMLSRSFRGVDYSYWEFNVIATITGSEYPSEIFVLGAHFDCILRSGGGDPFATAPGANDNASGVAAAMEVARVISSASFEPKYTIEFLAFGSEELGLWGSRDYAYKSWQNNRDIILMLNNDMIAVESKVNRDLWEVNVMDYTNSTGYGEYAQMLAEKYTTLTPFRDNSSNKYSDSYAFFEQDYPALFFHIGSSDPNYHTLDDISDNCNFEYCKEVTTISLAILVDKTY